ncbi:MAG: polyprenol monophosphomannose synthase [Thermodesulfobacteriota bacterium]
MRIAVVMPTYNEAANIGKMIETLFESVFPAIGTAEMHLVVADDTSPDGTGAIVAGYVKRFDRLHLSVGPRRGLGHAYVRGFVFAMERLAADAVVEMDADFQHDPRYLIDMAAAFSRGADCVIGSRFVAGGSIPAEWSWHRKLISVLGNRFARRMLGLDSIHDLTTGFRLTRVAGVLDRIDLSSLMALDRFAYKVDLVCRTLKLARTVVEVPIAFAPRHREKSKFRLSELITTYRVVVKLRMSGK